MPKQTSSSLILRILAISAAAIQVLDILIHAASNQLEPIRVLSNLLILLWIVLTAVRKFDALPQRISMGFVGVYLALNLVFLALEGVINPANGQPRIILVLLVGVTFLLSAVMTFMSREKS